MKKRFLSILLSLALCLSLLPATALATGTGNATEIANDTALQEALEQGNTNLKLTESISYGTAITISSSLTLDLNGFNLTYTSNSGGNFITVNSGGDLTIQDSSANGGGKVVGSPSAGNGVYISSGGSATMTGGTITNFTASDCYGVYINGGSFTMSGGTITSNTKGVYQDGTFKVKDSARVTGNNPIGGNACNVYLPEGKVITGPTITESFSGSVGVTTAEAPAEGGKINIVNVPSPILYTGGTQFSSDAGYTVMVNDTYLAIYRTPTTNVVTLNGTGYTSLSSAFTNVKNITDTDAVIALLDDLTTDDDGIVRGSYQPVVLDLANHTLTHTNRGQLSVTGGTLTVKNGTLTGEYFNGTIELTGGTLSIDSTVTVDNTATADGGAAIVADGGTLKVTSDTSTAVPQISSLKVKGDALKGQFGDGMTGTFGSITMVDNGTYDPAGKCVDLLAEGYAFFDGTTLVNANADTLTASANSGLKVGAHSTCTFDSTGFCACGREHNHSWSSSTGKCEGCGKTCAHASFNYDSHECSTCGWECQHTGVAAGSTCSVCGYTLPAAVTYVATVGGTDYTTFSAALDAAKDGNTVKLLEDVNESFGAISKSIVLNLDGHKLTNSGGYVTINASGKTVTITDGAETKGAIDDVLDIQAGNVKLTGGVVISDTVNCECVGGSLTVEDATLSKDLSLGEDGQTTATSLTMTGGTVTGTLYVKPGTTVTLSGGTFGSIDREGRVTDPETTIYDETKTYAQMLAEGCAYQDTSATEPTKLTDLPTYSLQNVKVVSCPHGATDSNGACAYCGMACTHANVTESSGVYTCNDCRQTMKACAWNNESDKKYFATADAAVNATVSSTYYSNVQLLESCDTEEVNTSHGFTLDLNGFGLKTLNVSGGDNALTVKDTSTAKTGAVNKLDGNAGITLYGGSYAAITAAGTRNLPTSYAFQDSSGDLMTRGEIDEYVEGGHYPTDVKVVPCTSTTHSYSGNACKYCNTACLHTNCTTATDGTVTCDNCKQTMKVRGTKTGSSSGYYPSVCDALEAGCTAVTLIADDTEEVRLSRVGTVSLDLNGHSLSTVVATGDDVTLTITNSGGSGTGYIDSLTREDGTVILTGGCYGTVAVEGDLTVAGLLKEGYAYQHNTTDGNMVSYSDLSGESITTVKVVKCTDHNIVSGKCQYCNSSLVASITKNGTTTTYTTFDAAYEAAATGDTIMLLGDAEFTGPHSSVAGYAYIKKSITLDLNGNTLTNKNTVPGSGGSSYIVVTAAVTITDNSSGSKKGQLGSSLRVDGTGGSVTLKGGVTLLKGAAALEGGKLTVENATIKSFTSVGSSGYGNGTLVMSGGTVNKLTVNSGSNATLSGGTYGEIHCTCTGGAGSLLAAGYGYKIQSSETNSWSDSSATDEDLTLDEGETCTVGKLPIQNVTISVDPDRTTFTYGESFTLTATVTCADDETTYNTTWYNSAVTPPTTSSGLSFSALKPAAGTHSYVFAINADGYVKFTTIEITVNKATLDYTAPTAKESLTYAEQLQLINAGTVNTADSGATMYYRVGTDGGWTTDAENVTSSSVGQITVQWYIDGGTNYNSVGSAEQPNTLTVNVGKADLSEDQYTAPSELASGLVYRANPQALIQAGAAGSAAGAEFKYRLGTDGDWTDTVPTATNAGNYTVYWYIDGGENYNDVGSETQPKGSIAVTIERMTVDPMIQFTEGDSFKYTGQAQTPEFNLVYGTDKTVIPKSEYTTEYDTDVNVGTRSVSVTCAEGGNYYFAATVTKSFEIIKADAPTLKDYTVNHYYADSSDQSFVIDLTDYGFPAGEALTNMVTLDSQYVKPTGVSASVSGGFDTAGKIRGSYSITNATVDHINDTVTFVLQIVSKNYENATFKIVVTLTKKAEKPLTVTMEGWTYGSVAKEPNYGSLPPNVISGKTEYKVRDALDTTYTQDVPTKAGDYTVRVTYETEAEIYSGTADFKIDRKPINEGMISVSSPTYNGTAQNANLSVSDGSTALTRGTDYSVSGTESATGAGDYTVTVTGEGNYTGTVNKTWTVGKKEISVEAYSNNSKPYDATTSVNLTGYLDFTGLIDGDDLVALDYSFTASYDSAAAGNRTITVNVTLKDTASANNYRLASTTAQLDATISKKSVNPNFNVADKPYDGTTAATVTATVPADRLCGTDSITITGLKGTFDTAEVGTNKKVYIDQTEMVITGSGWENYTVAIPAEISNAASITPAPATVTTAPTANTLTYNGKAQALVTAGAATNGTMQYSLNGTDWSATVPTGTDAGTYRVWYKAAGDGTNYSDSVESYVDVTVSTAASTVTGAPTANTLTYTGKAQALVTAGSAEHGTMQYSLNGTDWSASIPTGTNATGYTVWYKVVGDANYSDTQPASISVSIGKAALTVTAQAKVITYGDAPANNGVTYSGFVNGETANVLTGTLSYVYSYQQFGSVGDYTITPKGLTSGNYTITFVPGTLTVEQKTVGIDWTNTALTYNGQPQAPTASATGLVNGDSVTVTVSGAQTDVGDDYTATATALSSGNYRLPDTLPTTGFSIAPAALTGVSVSQTGSLTYNGRAQTATVATAGTALGGQTIRFTYSTAQDGAYFGSVPAFTTGTNTVWYRASADGHVTATGSFTVTVGKATVTVTAANRSAYTYTSAPDLSSPVAGKDYTVSGLFGSDTLDGITVTLSCDADMKKAGEYAIVPTVTGEDVRYDFVCVNGTLTVTVQPSSGVTTPTVTVPVSSDHAAVEVKAEVSNGNATIKVSNAQIDKVIADDAGTVTVDVSGLKNVDSATIPSRVVEKVNDAEDTGLTVALPAGSVTLDETALESVTETAKGKDVTVSVVSIPTANLSPIAKDVIGMDHTVIAVVDVNVIVNGAKQSSFDGGKVTVSIPYTPKPGEDTSKLTVWFIKDDGTIENKGGWYDAQNRCFVFETDHLSQYLLVNTNEVASFTDVPANAYYAAAVNWAVGNGITGGMGNNQFAPDATCTRAQLVTFLWRAAGCPVVNYAMSFTDVDENAWYGEAVRWAASLGIVGGYGNGLFGTNDTVTREQVATILYRYAAAMGMDVSVGEDTNILSYNDAFEVSGYAVSAFQWATGAGVVNGSDGNLMPGAGCTRAQIVTMLYRLLGK